MTRGIDDMKNMIVIKTKRKNKQESMTGYCGSCDCFRGHNAGDRECNRQRTVVVDPANSPSRLLRPPQLAFA